MLYRCVVDVYEVSSRDGKVSDLAGAQLDGVSAGTMFGDNSLAHQVEHQQHIFEILPVIGDRTGEPVFREKERVLVVCKFRFCVPASVKQTGLRAEGFFMKADDVLSGLVYKCRVGCRLSKGGERNEEQRKAH